MYLNEVGTENLCLELMKSAQIILVITSQQTYGGIKEMSALEPPAAEFLKVISMSVQFSPLSWQFPGNSREH